MGDRLYDTGAAALRLAFRVFGGPIDAAGQEHIPAAGPVILASNHISYIDFSFVALSQRSRRVRFMIRTDIMQLPLVGAALRAMGQIDIDPYGDPRPGYRQARRALEQGECVGVFPEGTISPSFVPMTAHSGAVRLAAAIGAPIVPVAVWGSQRILTKGRRPSLRRGIAVVVRYGDTFIVDPADRPREASEELMLRIEGLLKQAQDAYPQRPDGPDDTWWLPRHLGGTAPAVQEAAARIARQNDERRRARKRDRSRRGPAARRRRSLSRRPRSSDRRSAAG
ncbi:MAG TPA: lysophospholipid acyltransferase family protein [Nitriliruptorales bacterium]|nr:lysophospholipid acyltransferase family protein [Nitriliruptorales bacterium]